jgi:hypothetical protein
MTEPVHRGVRPAFLKLSAVAFVVLLPFVVSSTWGYVEDRRFDRALQEIQRRGEPTVPLTAVPTGLASAAERDYRAAAALASTFRVDAQVPLQRVASAIQKDEWPADALDALQSAMPQYDEALTLIDRGAQLPFDGFKPFTSYSSRTADLLGLQDLAGYRGILLALAGDSDGAVRALYAGTRLARTLGPYAFAQRISRPTVVAQVLERTKASPDSLARLGAALADLDDDRDLERWFMEVRRTAIFNSSQVLIMPPWKNVAGTLFLVRRPWARHFLNGQLDTYAALIDAAKGPWPDRIDRVNAVGAGDIFPTRLATPDTATADLVRTPLEGFVLANVSQTAGFRCLRIIVAVERYRRDHGEQLPATLGELAPAYVPAVPIDPFSGKPLLLKKESAAYTVYSVGTNRKDDGGGSANLPYWAFPSTPSADIGVRVRIR